MILRRLRAAHIIAHSGYFGGAVALLRDVFDRCIHLAAVAKNLCTYEQLMGVGNEAIEDKKRRKRQKEIEVRLVREFIGANSGLTEDDINELGVLRDLFHREVHGSFLSFSTITLDWLKGNRDSLLDIRVDDNIATMFLNRFNECSWMFHRLLIINQSTHHQFDDEWKTRWTVLDESLWQMEDGLAGLGKPIGDAFIRFMDAKFLFGLDSTLPPPINE